MPVIEIKDLTMPALLPYAGLTQAQLRSRRHPEQAMFIAESPKVISAALDSGCRPVSFLMDRKHIQGQGAALLERCGDVPVYTADGAVLEQLTGFALTRGILCAMRRPELPTPEEICGKASRIAVLEGIVDPTNVGAIFRSAAALNMDAVLLTSSCCDPLYRRSVRVSMGTVFQVPWAFLSPGWEEDGPALLSSWGFTTAAMALRSDALAVDDPRLTAPERLAIVLGAEGDGLRPDTVARCDYTVRIPMSHGVDSLNVAAASAVAFWQ